MNVFDSLIIVVLALMLARGLWAGLIREVCGIAGLWVGAALAARYDEPLAAQLPAWSWIPPGQVQGACFVVLLLATLLFFGILGTILSRVCQAVLLGGLNRVLGGLSGLAKGALFLSLLLYGLFSTAWFAESRQQSRLAPPFVTFGERLLAGGQRLLH